MSEIDTKSPEFREAVKEAMQDDDFRTEVESEFVPGLKSALDKERQNAKDLKKQLDAYRDIDPAEYAKLKKSAREAEAARAKQEGDWEKRESQLKSQFDETLAKRDGRIKTLEGALQQTLIENTATMAITEAGGSVRLLLPHVRDVVRLEESGEGKFRAVVIDENGTPRLRENAKTSGDLMDIKEYVVSLKELPEFAGAFKGTGASGGGSTGSVTTGGAGSRTIANDPISIGRNLEDVAKGKVKVQM